MKRRKTTLPQPARFFARYDAQSRSYNIYQRDRRNDFGERYCVEVGLSEEECDKILHKLNVKDRIFSGIYPTGVSYADRWKEKDGDYKRLAFLSFSSLELKIETDCPQDLRAQIKEDAAKIQAQRGQQFRISQAGQTITLGE